MQIHPVTDDRGTLIAPEWLARAPAVHQQLRERLSADYAGTMQRVFAQGGCMSVAADGEHVVGVAVYRIYENTYEGLQLYVDDLVTDEAARSAGVGRTLLRHLEGVARTRGCEWITLDSGTQRHRAHAFYFREGMAIGAYSFRKKLSP